MNEVKKMVEGKNPEQVFFEECQKRGIDANYILNLAKMFK